MKIHFNRKKLTLFTFLLLITLTASTRSFAQDEPPSAKSQIENFIAQNSGQSEPVSQPSIAVEMAILAGLALLPFAIMLLTSYLKMVIVLSLMRNAIGVQNSPPNQALTGIALIMAIYVMYPTGVAMYKASEQFIEEAAPEKLFSQNTALYLMGILDRAKGPMRHFLEKNSSAKHIQLFYRLGEKSIAGTSGTDLKPTDFIIVVPAFITSQLKSAFEIGVLIYLPFFVIDLVTSNILLAMGMMMLSPLTIALPLKLLLIVMVDGWTLVIDGIVKTFR